MAQIYGDTGVSPRMLAERRRRLWKWLIAMTVFVALLALFSLFWAIRNALQTPTLVACIVLVATIIYMIVQLRAYIREVQTARVTIKKRTADAEEGAWAEDMIGKLLEKLPDDYAVFHGLPCPGGDIDHIVVGKTGLFVIETKSHSGRVVIEVDEITLNGHAFEKDILHQVLNSAKWLEEMLLVNAGLEVRPLRLIVFTRAYVEQKVKPPFKGLYFMHRSFLQKFILQNDAANVPVADIIDMLKRKMVVTSPNPVAVADDAPGTNLPDAAV